MRPRVLLAVPLLVLTACTSSHTTGPFAGPTSRAVSPQSSTPQSSAPPAEASALVSWPAYHGDAARTGYAHSMPTAAGPPKVTATIGLDGHVYASPIVVRGRVVVATENDSVYAIDNGTIAWRRHLGSPAQGDELPCGNIHPLGITGTPVYSGGFVYVVAEFGGPPRHVLYSIKLSDGSVAWEKSVDLPGVETKAMQERGALTVAGGRVWVPFGGLAGDCGGYKGRVVGVRLDGTGRAISYTVPTPREGGIWTPPGPAFDGRYLYVAVGNGEIGRRGGGYDRSDSVLKLSTSAKLVQLFSPSTWRADNDGDLDLGSQGPTLLGKWVFTDGKRGTAYVLRRANLGGIGHQVSSRALCQSFGGTAVVGIRIYVPCTDGVRGIWIDSTGKIRVLWHAPSAITGSPIVGGGRVWTLDVGAGRLHSLDPMTGAERGSVPVGAVSRFATPAAYGRTLYVPTMSGLTIVTTS